MDGDELRAVLHAAATGGPGLRRGLWVTFLDAFGLEVVVAGQGDRPGVDWLAVDLQHGNLEPRDVPGLLGPPRSWVGVRAARRRVATVLNRSPSKRPAS